MTRPPAQIGIKTSRTQDTITSTLNEIAFVTVLIAQPDEVLPTWRIKLISRRLAGHDDRLKPIQNSLGWSHDRVPMSLLIN